MALNLDTRIPLLSVDPNFNPSKSFNDAADAAVKQQQMTISNRLEKMKADREMAQAEREAKRAEQYAQMFAAMKQGTPATMSEGTPATQSQYQFGQPEQTPGYNVNDMLTGRVDPQAALGLLTQQPSNVTPGSPAVPPQELVPAVPGREPTVEDMMRMYGEASLGAGDFKEGIDTFKALGGYSKDMRPQAGEKPQIIGGIVGIKTAKFPKGEAAYNQRMPDGTTETVFLNYGHIPTEQAQQRITISGNRADDASKRGWAGLSLRGQAIANQRAKWEQSGNNVKTFISSNPDGTSSIRGAVFDRSGRQVNAFVVRDENGAAMSPKPGEVNARRNAGMVVAAEEATAKMRSLGELGGMATSFVQDAANLKDPSYIKQYMDSRTRGMTDTRKQLLKQEFSGLARMAATVAGGGVVNSQAAIDSFEKMMATPEGSSPEGVNMAFLNVAAAIKAGLKHPIPGMSPGQVKQFDDLMGFYNKYPSPEDYAVFLKRQGLIPKNAGYKFDGVELSAPITREVVYDDDTGEFVPADEGGDGGYGGHNAAPAQPQVAPTQPLTKPQLYDKYVSKRDEAYANGEFAKVHAYDQAALKAGLISALPKIKMKGK